MSGSSNNDLAKSLQVSSKNLDSKIKKEQDNIAIQKTYIKDKLDEIIKHKKWISDDLEGEARSKKLIKKHIDMLGDQIEKMDDSVEELKKSFILKVKSVIKESSSEFEVYIDDIGELMAPLAKPLTLGKKDEISETIMHIVSTLELFVENIETSVNMIIENVEENTNDAVKESEKGFGSFIVLIQKIFEKFSVILKELKITNSINRYSKLEVIYTEVNQRIDECKKITDKLTKLQVDKNYYDSLFKIIKPHGGLENTNILHSIKEDVEKNIEENNEKLELIHVDIQELEEKMELIDVEKLNVHSFFQALSDEIIEYQDTSVMIYNDMYSVLGSIQDYVPIINNEIVASTKAAVQKVIAEFIQGIKTFEKITTIINKVQNVSELTKMQQYLKQINIKSKTNLKKVRSILKKLVGEVNTANKGTIDTGFIEFYDFIENFKIKFIIIRESVGTITLSTSSNLISDLQSFSDDQITLRLKLHEKKKEYAIYSQLNDKYEKYLQGISNKLKIYTKTGGQHSLNRLEILYKKKFVETPHTHIHVHNTGLTPISDINLYTNKFNSLSYHKYSNKPNEESASFLHWHFSNLEKRTELGEITYNVSGISPLQEFSNLSTYNQHITTPRRYRHRRIACPVQLDILEEDGKGAIILKNMADEDTLWNICLEFKPTPDINSPPNISIEQLGAQESVIKKYTYKKPNALIPYKFIALASCQFGCILKEDTSQEVTSYSHEISFKNNSEFLIHLISYKIYHVNHAKTMTIPKSPVIEVKSHNLEKIRPNLEFKKEFNIKIPKNKTKDSGFPNLLIDCTYSCHLVYDYITPNIKLSDLKETSEKGVKNSVVEKVRYSSKSKNEKNHSLHDDLTEIDDKVEEIQQEIFTYEDKISQLKKERDDYLEDREEILLKIKSENKSGKNKKDDEQAELKKIQKNKQIIEEMEKETEQLKKLMKEEKTSKTNGNSSPKSKTTQKSKSSPKSTEVNYDQFADTLQKVNTINQADTVAILINADAANIIKAIELKDRTIKRKTRPFKELVSQRKKLKNRELIYFSVEVGKQLNSIMNKEALKYKKNVIWRYFKGSPK